MARFCNSFISEDVHDGFWFRDGRITSLSSDGGHIWDLSIVLATDGKTEQRAFESFGPDLYFTLRILSIDSKQIVSNSHNFIATFDLQTRTVSRKFADSIIGSDSKGSIYSVSYETLIRRKFQSSVRGRIISQQSYNNEMKWQLCSRSDDWIKSICLANGDRMFVSFGRTLLELKLGKALEAEQKREWNIPFMELICYLPTEYLIGIREKQLVVIDLLSGDSHQFVEILDVTWASVDALHNQMIVAREISSNGINECHLFDISSLYLSPK